MKNTVAKLYTRRKNKMTETQAMNKKCPFQFNQGTQEFNYCITDLCMSWHEEKGGCLRLINGQCDCLLKETGFDMDGIR